MTTIADLMPPEDEAGELGIREAAAAVRLSEETIRRLIKEGKLPYILKGNRKLVRRADLFAEPATARMPAAQSPAAPIAADQPRPAQPQPVQPQPTQPAQPEQKERSDGSNPVQAADRPGGSSATRSAIDALRAQTGGHPPRQVGQGKGAGSKGRR